jgi:hypothetical protein
VLVRTSFLEGQVLRVAVMHYRPTTRPRTGPMVCFSVPKLVA